MNAETAEMKKGASSGPRDTASSIGTLTDRVSQLASLDAEIRSALRTTRGTEAALSWLRLALFGLAIAAFLVLDTNSYLPYAACLALILPFFAVVGQHRKIMRRRKIAENKLAACQETAQRLGGKIVCINDWHEPSAADEQTEVEGFFEDGQTWTITAQEVQDLDIHNGPVGLFGLLNRSATIAGRRRLQHFFLHPLLETDVLIKRQDAVHDLAKDTETRLQVMGAMAAARHQDDAFDRLTSALRHATPIASNGTLVALRAWGYLSLVLFFAFMYLAGTGSIAWTYLILLLLGLNAIILRQFQSVLESEIKRWKKSGAAVAILDDAVRTGAEVLPGNGPLGEIRKALQTVVELGKLPALARSIAWTESGGLFHIISNLVFLFDIHILHAIQKHAIGHRGELQRSLSAVAELDALCSLACFAWEQKEAIFPQTVDHHTLTIDQGQHPLIDPDIAVTNSVHLDTNTRIWIVTGSNMAGKSTLLRMTAVNVLLAQMGSAVLAKHMTWSLVRLITDLQAHDSLADGESYFLAEVRHLKRLVAPPDGPAPIFGIVDEPLRGTNSPEQTAAGIALVDDLRASGHFFMIATHEHEITNLADNATIKNYHFEERLDDDGMVFDYLLRDGPATTRNAIRVLEREGFPESLINRARQWLRDTHGDF
ncbi:MAG: MutS-related protein [Phycisphaerae bacterium]